MDTSKSPLPIARTGEEMYLRAILEELQGIRAALAVREPASKPSLEVREPEADFKEFVPGPVDKNTGMVTLTEKKRKR